MSPAPDQRVTSSRRRILDVAGELFAAYGYEGVSTRQIAAGAGLNIATVAHHVGGKRDLYLAVLEEFHDRERAVFEHALAALPDPLPAGPAARRDALLSVLDAYLDFCLATPQVPALWMRRWLSDADDVRSVERAYAAPLYRMLERVLAEACVDADPHLALRTVVWTIYGYCTGGVLDVRGERVAPTDPAARRAFRAHLRTLVARMLGFPDPDMSGVPDPET